jgi:hypothetical protein
MNAFGCWTFAVFTTMRVPLSQGWDWARLYGEDVLAGRGCRARALEASARSESGISLLNPSKLNAFDPKQTGLLANQL